MPGADFDSFAAAAWPRLRWAAYLLCGDHQLAEDLAQSALARTYARWRRVRRADALAYARATLVNLNIDRLRRDKGLEVLSDVVPDTETSTSAGGSFEERQEVLQLMQHLTHRERQVVVLRYYFDLTEQAVADELGIAIGTVKSAHARALARLRLKSDLIHSTEPTRRQA